MPNNKNLKPSRRSFDDLQLAMETAVFYITNAKNDLTKGNPKSGEAYQLKDQLRAYSFILNLLEEKRRRMNSQLIVAKYGKIKNFAKHIGVAESYVHALIHEHITNPDNELYKAVQAEIAQLKNDLE